MGIGGQIPNFSAAGTILPFSCVKATASDPFKVVVSDDEQDVILGVTDGATRAFDSSLHSIAGDPVNLQNAKFMQVRAAETIAVGDGLRPTTNGAVAKATLRISFIACDNAVTDEIFWVQQVGTVDNPGVANVLEFGAKGDGVTDDTAALQAALSSAEKSIYIPAGTYITSTLTITAVNKLLFGPGTLKLKAAANYPILQATSAHYLKITGITFDGNRASAGSGTFAVQLTTTNNAKFENVTFNNTRGGLKLLQSPDAAVTGQRSFDFNETQVEINDGSHRTTVSNSSFDDNGQMGQGLHVIDCEGQAADLTDCLISGCVVQSVGTPVQFTSTYVKRCVISGNVFRNNSTGGQGNCIKMDSVGAGCVVTGNTLFFTNYGIIEGSVTNPVVYHGNVMKFNSVATGATQNGMSIDCPGAILQNNVVYGALNDGYSFANSAAGCQVFQNMAIDCGRDGFNVESAGTTKCVFFGNASINCTRYGFRCDANDNAWINHTIKDCDGVYGAYVAGSNNEIIDPRIEGNVSNLVRFNSTATGCRVRVFTSSQVANLPASSYLSVLDRDLNGTGTPEGVVTAGIGAIFRRLDGGLNTSLYVKQSGSGNTGWYAVTP